jgi:hypothetical protein
MITDRAEVDGTSALFVEATHWAPRGRRSASSHLHNQGVQWYNLDT